MGKLFCTFIKFESLDETIDTLQSRYEIMYGKIFVLESDDNTNEYIVTYNIDSFNLNGSILENTILMHRKKDSNTLYTINSLNLLIKQLNNNQLDSNYKINWSDYKNSILLTQNNEFKKLNTKIFKIISF